MGIRRLYSHLLPYARPEAFSSSSDTTTPIYIDGPALCHHIYHLIFCAGSTTDGNAFENTLPYRSFALAYDSYLRRLEISGFHIAKILFDSALPPSKAPTRISRLQDSLRKLCYYRNANPTLRHGTPAVVDTPETFFDAGSANRTFAPRTQPLSAPPFIVAAALSWSSAHGRYAEVTETVPGEADAYLAAAATRYGGVVLTGDSDLLVFGDDGESGCGWGVIMMQDLTFADTGVSARVFRLADVARTLKHPLLQIAYQTSLDSNASLSQILERLARIEERRRQGAGAQQVPEAFRREYTLPLPLPRGARMVEEPRIGELLFLAAKGSTQRKMYLPFINEDPQRSPAWDVAAGLRALAYSLLFPDGEVKEVFRRGTRIVEIPVPCDALTEEAITAQAERMSEEPQSWWASVVLDEICGVARQRNQPEPSRDELVAAASILLPDQSFTLPVKTRQKWTWGLVHAFAMVQVGWYSLLLLREVLAFLSSRGTAMPEHVAIMRKGLLQLPDVLDIFDGRVFLSGFDTPRQKPVQLGNGALARYWNAIRAEREEEEEEEAAPASAINGSGKRRSEEAGMGEGEWMTVDSKKTKKHKRKKEKETGAGRSAALDSANKFAMLSTDI